MQYIGETGKAFRQRTYAHIASVKKPKNFETPFSKRFHLGDHSYINMRFCVIEWLGIKIYSNTQNKYRAKEKIKRSSH